MTRLHRLGNRLIAPLIRAGFIPHTYLLATRGRRTGKATHDAGRCSSSTKGGARWSPVRRGGLGAQRTRCRRGCPETARHDYAIRDP